MTRKSEGVGRVRRKIDRFIYKSIHAQDENKIYWMVFVLPPVKWPSQLMTNERPLPRATETECGMRNPELDRPQEQLGISICNAAKSWRRTHPASSTHQLYPSEMILKLIHQSGLWSHHSHPIGNELGFLKTNQQIIRDNLPATSIQFSFRTSIWPANPNGQTGRRPDGRALTKTELELANKLERS